MTALSGTAVGATTASTGRPRRRDPDRRTDGWWPWLFVLPTTIGVAVFYLWPIVQNFYISLTSTGPFGGSTFTGLDNYRTLAQDPDVVRALVNTVIYTLIVLLGVPIAVFLSSLINRPGLRLAGVYRAIYFLPYVAMPTAIALVWRLIYNGDFGVLNWFLSLFGIQGPAWASTEWYALFAVGILGLWMSLGFNMIILSAGLKGIPAEMYEAASLDGATNWQQFRRITIPLLSPSIFFVTVITVINGFQLFDLLYALMGQRNPVMSKTQSLVYLFYNEAFVNNDKGYAAAVAVLILVIIGAVTFLQFRLQRRWVHE